MVSTSGSRLLPTEAVRDLREDLLPHTTILTPNVPEALLLLSDAGLPAEAPRNVNELIEIAKAVQSLGPKFVLLKGGHLPLKKNGDVARTAAERVLMVDILYGEGIVTRMETAYQNSKNTHGTGCSLACELTVVTSRKLHILTILAAIASNLANGLDIVRAVKRACRYVEAGIKTSTDLGHGNGPIDHFHSTYTLPFAP
jgi:hydroxymethylpyrimidine kinase/phosphomethylpyrimidine kinase